MTGTMLSVDHSQRSGATVVDITPLIRSLTEMTKAIQASAERPVGEIRVPFPEIHNEYNVPTPQIDVHVPAVENRVVVEPTPVHVNVSAPDVNNDIRCEFPDLKKVVVSLYVLSGVIGGSALGIITILLRH